ncbi:class I SAM-dependent methyltransferase [Pseudalkalibacillus sp. SCS-8]|uniref:class I SAM-dependent methyltransferase n=1 Tax=Pseudalkalibacillus nanhaiensis TaxID=3115291 RepID=UPI0032DA3C12
MNWAKRSVDRWDEHAIWWDEMETLWKDGPRATILEFFFHFIGDEPKCILDLGCGPGISTSLMIEKGHHAVGTDHSPNMIQKATERGVEVFKSNDNRLPFQDEVFNVVFACTSLEWTDEPHQLIKETHRVLKPAGDFVAVTLGPYANPRSHGYDRLYGNFVVHNMMMPWELHQLLDDHEFEHKENFGVYTGAHSPYPKIIDLLGENWVAKSALSYLYAFATRKK